MKKLEFNVQKDEFTPKFEEDLMAYYQDGRKKR